jgi:hypothetical protein
VELGCVPALGGCLGLRLCPSLLAALLSQSDKTAVAVPEGEETRNVNWKRKSLEISVAGMEYAINLFNQCLINQVKSKWIGSRRPVERAPWIPSIDVARWPNPKHKLSCSLTI